MSPPKTESMGGVSVRRILSLARPERSRIIIGTVFLAIGSAMGLAYPQAVRVLLDEALAARDATVVNQAAIALVGVFAIQAIANALRYYLFTLAGERVVARLRRHLYAAVVGQEISFFDSQRTGELTNRLSADTGVIQNAVSVNISMLLRGAATVLGGITLMVWTSPRLTAMTLGVIPPIVISAVIVGRFVRKLSRQVQDDLARAGEVAEETISGIRTVRAFAREEKEVERYSAAIETSLEHARRRIGVTGWFHGVTTFLGFGALALVLWYGGHLVIDGALSLGEMTAFILYTGVVAVSLGSLTSLYTDFMRAAGAAERVFELMDRTPSIPNRGGDQAESVRGHLRFESVGFTYPTRPDVRVLDAVDLELEPGKRVALVGPSGGGKSTIAALIPRFYDPDRGRITLDGRDLRDFDPGWLRQQIGTVAQEPILFSTSIRENILYGAGLGAQAGTLASADIEAAARAANAHDFVVRFPEGYETLVGERGVQLSGGQKQRVAIARALLRDPRILILDEATSALDSESEQLVKDALERLMEGRTTLVIAHRLATVREADRVVVIDGGRVVESGTHGDLIDTPDGLYRRLVEHQLLEA